MSKTEENAAALPFELINLGGRISFHLPKVDEDNKPILDKDGVQTFSNESMTIEQVLDLFHTISGHEDNRDNAQGEIDAKDGTLSALIVGIAEKVASEIEAAEMVHYRGDDIPKRAAMFDEVVRDLAKKTKDAGKHTPKALRQRKSDVKRALIHGIEPEGKTCRQMKKEGLAAKNTDDKGKPNNFKAALDDVQKVMSEYRKAVKDDEVIETAADTLDINATKELNKLAAKYRKELDNLKKKHTPKEVQQVEGETDEDEVITPAATGTGG